MAILIHVSVALDQQDRILLVQEQKPENRGRWNLPGGHLELGETIQDGALREVREEAGLQVRLSELVGIYSSIRPPEYHAIRFVFTGDHDGREPVAGDDILAVQWYTLAEVETLPDAALVGGEDCGGFSILTPDGRRRTIRTTSFHCGSCGQFVRSEEAEELLAGQSEAKGVGSAR